MIGHPIHSESSRVLGNLGGDSSGFTARQLTPQIASSADLIITMARAHFDRVLMLAPQKLHKTFTLVEAAQLATDYGAECVADLPGLRPHLKVDGLLDIPDPIGQSPEVFDSVGMQIRNLLPPLLDLCRRSWVRSV